MKSNADLMMNYTKKPPVDIATSRVKRTVGISAYDSPAEIRNKLAAAGVDVSSLRVRPLSYEEIQEMKGTPEELYHLHPQGNEKNYNAAIEKHDRVLAEIRADDKKSRADGLVAFFTELNSPSRTQGVSKESAALIQAITNTVRAFAEKYPQFRADSTAEKVRANYERGLRYISNALLDPTLESSWATALTELGKRGHIIINDGDGNLLSGQALAEHPNLHDLLLPVMTRAQKKDKENRDAISRMSSDEFYASRTPEEQEDIERGKYLPGVYDRHKAARQKEVEKSYAQASASFMALCPTYESSSENQELLMQWHYDHNTHMTPTSLQAAFRELCASGKIKPQASADVRYGGSRFVDNGAGRVHHHGQEIPSIPLQKDKKTFATWVKNHSSHDFKERCASEPEFRAWADGGMNE